MWIMVLIFVLMFYFNFAVFFGGLGGRRLTDWGLVRVRYVDLLTIRGVVAPIGLGYFLGYFGEDSRGS